MSASESIYSAAMKNQPAASNSVLNLLRAMPGRIVALLQKHVEERQRIAAHQRLSTRATADENVAAQQRQAEELATLKTNDLAAIAGLRGDAAKYHVGAQSEIERQIAGPAPADFDEARGKRRSRTLRLGKMAPCVGPARAGGARWRGPGAGKRSPREK